MGCGHSGSMNELTAAEKMEADLQRIRDGIDIQIWLVRPDQPRLKVQVQAGGTVDDLRLGVVKALGLEPRYAEMFNLTHNGKPLNPEDTIEEAQLKADDEIAADEVDVLAAQEDQERRSSKKTDVREAVTFGDQDKLRILAKHHPKKLEETDSYGNTPLHWASIENRLPMVQLLLELKAKVDTADNQQRTALHWAVIEGRTEVVSVLLEAKADIKHKDSKGERPIELAKKGSEIEKLLLAARPKPDAGLNSRTTVVRRKPANKPLADGRVQRCVQMD